ncbi:MAG: COG1683: Uncharacterized conserved protein / FIG143828: Hypothetical protein YbgA, partial [uncultured Campylobacterales bacterium]
MNLGVSSCLIGNKCRYDGDAKTDDFVSQTLGKYFELIPYCPEAEIFGIPRESIRQINIDGKTQILSNSTKRNLTKPLEAKCHELALRFENDNLSGFVFKSKSPTCGVERVKVYQGDNRPSKWDGVGVFVKEVKSLYPYLPIEEEGRLNDSWLKENFMAQVYAYADLKNLLQTKEYKSLVDFHTNYKYLIYSKSQVQYKVLGNIVANHLKKDFKEVLNTYSQEFLKTISIKNSINKTYNVLEHLFGYFKTMISSIEKKEILKIMNEYKEGIIPLIAVIKIINLYVIKFDVKYLKTQKF